MINIFSKNEIIMRYRKGESQRKISENLKVSRITVKKYISEYEELLKKLDKETNDAKIALIQNEMCSKPKRKKFKHASSKFSGELEQRFNELIEIDRQRDLVLGVNKQKLTSTLLRDTLVAEGFDISLSTINNKFKEYKNRNPECYIKQVYDYGVRAEYDFHQFKVYVAGEIITMHMATISLNNSNHVYPILYRNENQKTVLDSIIKFINHCNGVTKTIVFDNMSTVVKRFLIDNQKQYTDEIIKLSTYYGFEIITCNARSGNEKGHVENSGKVFRKKYYSLKYKFDSMEELYEYHEQMIAKHNKSNEKAFELEKQYLSSKPTHDYIIHEVKEYKVNSYSLINVQNNYYSVPDNLINKKVTINIIKDKLYIYCNEIFICDHKILKGIKEYRMNIMHYLPTFLKKPGALANSLTMKQAPEELKRVFKEDYNMNTKKFIESLLNPTTYIDDDIHSSILDVSKSQLNSISNIFNQGEK